MIRSIITYFYGSTPDDFNQAVENSLFKECPDSPNCTYHAVKIDKEATELFELVHSVMRNISPYRMDADSKSLQIDAVFRIPVFGFKDDLRIIIKADETGGSILYVKSSSRIGESDLGVNRRRIQQILSTIHQQIL